MKTETTTPAPKVGSSDIVRPHWITAPRGYAELGSVNDTPETDALRQKLLGEKWSDSYLTMMSHARKLERERDEARLLCRWAFPRLRAMCHDFDATGTGWCCAEEMESHPEIFSSENQEISDG